MKRAVIRILSLLLSLLLLTSLAAVSVAEEAGDRFGKYDEPVKVSILSTDLKDSAMQYDSSDPTRRSAAQNAWISGYSEYLNIDLERVMAENTDALNARINTGLASGDLPDILIVPKNIFYVMAENGVLQDLSAAYESYAEGTHLRQVVATNPDALSTGMYEGELLGFPQIDNSYNSTKLLHVRQDWLDKFGMEIPTTIDEMIAVAKAFQAAQLGGENTIGLGIKDVSEPFVSAYGAILGTWAEQEDGSYAFANTLDEVKPALLKLQELYADNVIKRDFAVTNILNEEIANGFCGMFYGEGWMTVTAIQANMNNDPDAVWAQARIPTLDGGYVKQWTNNAINTYLVVTKGCENPEALFKLIEMELHMFYEPNAEEIVQYYICEDGYKMWNLRVFRNFVRADSDLYKSQLIQEGYAAGATEIDPLADGAYQIMLQGLAGDRTVLGESLVMMGSYPIVLGLKEQGLLVGAYNGPITENMSLYEGTLREELTNAMLKVIMGEDIAVFEEAVTTWYATGGQAITDDVNAYYQSLK